MANITAAVHVLKLTDAGAQVATFASTSEPFWLPRDRYTAWASPPEPGRTTTVVLPEWLASKHQQLQGVLAYGKSVRAAYAKPTSRRESEMAFEQKDMSGALFRIDPDKRKSENGPEFDGSITIRGEKFFLAGWVRESKSGKKYFSLSAKPAEEKPTAPAKAAAPARNGGGFAKPVDDDTIPFAPEWRG